MVVLSTVLVLIFGLFISVEHQPILSWTDGFYLFHLVYNPKIVPTGGEASFLRPKTSLKVSNMRIGQY